MAIRDHHPLPAPVMRVLIADDEPLALERLQTALACIPEAVVVGAANTGTLAQALIRELEPDVVILDIEMPGKTGLSLVEDLKPGDHVPEVVFVTAFSQYAVRAFQIAAADYLTKPIEFARLRDAVRRARARLDARTADQRFSDLQALVSSLQAQAQSDSAGHDTSIWIRRKSEMVRLPVGMITVIEAQGDYVLLHTDEDSHFHRDTISALEQRLDPAQFVRCHRSRIVNLGHIRSFRRRPGKGLTLTLADGRAILVGPSYVQTVMEAANLRRWRA